MTVIRDEGKIRWVDPVEVEAAKRRGAVIEQAPAAPRRNRDATESARAIAMLAGRKR